MYRQQLGVRVHIWVNPKDSWVCRWSLGGGSSWSSISWVGSSMCHCLCCGEAAFSLGEVWGCLEEPPITPILLAHHHATQGAASLHSAPVVPPAWIQNNPLLLSVQASVTLRRLPRQWGPSQCCPCQLWTRAHAASQAGCGLQPRTECRRRLEVSLCR